MEVSVRATQLFGRRGLECEWALPAHVAGPARATLAPAHSCAAALRLALPAPRAEGPETDVIT